MNLVNVPVTVTDGKGRPVAGLVRDDFVLSEDGRPESIRLFQANATQPLSIVLAIDTSVSVRRDLPVARQAAYDFAHSLLRPGDQMELIGFAGDVTEVVPFTGSLHRMDRGLRALHGDGPTALYAAIARAAKDLEPLPGRKVIVVISDGSNSMAGTDYEQAGTAALRAQASLESIILVPIDASAAQASLESIILVPIDASAGRDLGGEHALIQLSQDTGGQFFYADAANQVQDAMAHLSLALRSEYLLGYYPASTRAGSAQVGSAEMGSAGVGKDSGMNGFRHIQVRMAKPTLNRVYHLVYRTGYTAQAAH